MLTSSNSHEFETALREECFYQFALPYWDQSLDAANWDASPLFNDFLGFGGNGKEVGGDPQFPGSTGGGCISSGIFKHTKVHIDYANRETSGISRCVKRAFYTAFSQLWLGSHRITQALQATNFAQFEQILEGDVNFADVAAALGVHNAGHSAVGGDMSDMYISSGDPLFL